MHNLAYGRRCCCACCALPRASAWGGEWGGAALLATEYAPEGRRGWYGMFPQLGPSVGFLLATLTFLALSLTLTEAQFAAWGWRIPFIASAGLVVLGLYIRLRLAETPAFSQALATHQTHALPLRQLLSQHLRRILLAALAMGVCYHLFYTATVFCLSYGTQTLGISRPQFLAMLCIAVLGMALMTPLAAAWSDRFGRRPVLIVGGVCAMVLGGGLSSMLASGQPWLITLFLFLALALMGSIFAPMGAFLPEQFPVAVRYSGAGISYQLGGILGASFAPGISQALVARGGLEWVGVYMSAMALVSVLAVLAMRKPAPAA